MKTKTILFISTCLCLLAVQLTFAKERKIRYKIVDKVTSVRLAEAKLTIFRLENGQRKLIRQLKTDGHGVVALSLDGQQGDYEIEVSAAGYEATSLSLYFKSDKEEDSSFFLQHTIKLDAALNVQ